MVLGAPSREGRARGSTFQSGGRWPLQPGIVTRLGHAEHACHRGNREAGLVRAHEPEEPDGSVPVSRANQAAAFERISRSSRSCLFSRRSRVNSSRSNAVRPGAASSRRPSFRSSLGDPRANGVAAWLKLAGKIVRITSSTDEVDHLSAKLRRIRWTCSWHRQHLWRETSGCPPNRVNPTSPCRTPRVRDRSRSNRSPPPR